MSASLWPWLRPLTPRMQSFTQLWRRIVKPSFAVGPTGSIPLP